MTTRTCFLFCCIVVVGLLSGCATSEPPAQPPAPVIPLFSLPATLAGQLPCADCAGQAWTLVLFQDQTFRLRRTYLAAGGDEDRDFFSLGRWSADPVTSHRIRLEQRDEFFEWFVYKAPDRLRKLDRAGNEIESTLNYDLTLQNDIDPVAGPMLLTGMYVYMADAATLEECNTGRSFPVIITADHLAVERAYLRDRQAPGEAMLLDFLGRFVDRPPEPGLPPRQHLIIEEFFEFRPDDSCAPPEP